MTRKYTIPTAFTSERIYRTIDASSLTLLNQLFGGALAMEQAQEATPLTQWTGDYWGNPRMTPAEAMEKWGVTNQVPVANIAPGDINPFFRFIDDITKTGNVISRGPEITTMEMVNSDDMFWIGSGVGRILLLCAVGGDLEGWQVFYKIPEAAYETDVPTGFPFGTVTEVIDDEEVTRPRLWSEYKDEFHEHQLVDGYYYIASNSFDRMPAASEWFMFALGGLEIVTSVPVATAEV